MRVYLDSCIIIYLMEGDAGIKASVKRRLRPEGAAAPFVVFSDLSRLECRVKPIATPDLQLLADYDGFFATPGYIKAAVDTATFDLATQMRAGSGLKTADALHLRRSVVSQFVGNKPRRP